MNSCKLTFLCAIILMVISNLSIAEIPAQKGIIKGSVFDKKAKIPVEYATVSIFNASDNSLITGCITNEKGIFVIKDMKKGKYNLSITFIGYEIKEIKNVEINDANKTTDIGKILLDQLRTVLNEINIKGNSSNVEYKIDKKVVSVSDKLTSSGMSAIEVLENVPSVKVDMDGNISLRGSSSFTVLVDGKPTILDASDILQQTPASSIQNIEIITNASAKYSPDGTGGIINIITKKNKSKGVSGIVNLKFGSFNSKSSDFLVNLQRKKINFFVSGNYSNHERRSTITEEKKIISEINSKGESERSRIGKKISAGLSWNISDNDILDLSGTIANNNFNSSSSLDYTTNSISQKSDNTGERIADMFSFNGGYIHKFAQKDHELTLTFNYRGMDSENTSLNTLINEDENINNGTKTLISGLGKKSEIKLDYTLPVSDLAKFEAGVQIRKVHKDDVSTIERYMHSKIDNSLTYDVFFDRDIYSVYSMFSNKTGNLSYQLGIRGEKSVREISSSEDNNSYKVNDFDFFPTVHFSYNLQEGNQLQASYSRRVERPRGFSLLPREIWYDMYNVRKGNPNLRNEYVNVIELTYLKDWDMSRLSFETFYRISENKQERIISLYPMDNLSEEEREKFSDVTLHTVDNVGKSYAIGFETMYNIDLLNFWNISCSVDGYNYKISSDVKSVKDVNTFKWSASITNKFKINKKLDLQIDNRYRGKSRGSQSVIKPMYSANAALRAKITRNLSLTTQFRNIFNTQEFKIETIKDNYQVYKTYKSKPSFMISLSYRINNFSFKNKKKSSGGDDFNDDGMY